jgi:hypothetical protein
VRERERVRDLVRVGDRERVRDRVREGGRVGVRVGVLERLGIRERLRDGVNTCVGVDVGDGDGDPDCDGLAVPVIEGLLLIVVSTRYLGIGSTTKFFAGLCEHTCPRIFAAIADVARRRKVESFIIYIPCLRRKTFFRFQYKCPYQLLMRLLSRV